MRMRTPAEKPTKYASPPMGLGVPLQQCRPSSRLQQARTKEPLELFEPTPVPVRYRQAIDSPYVTPHYPSQYPRRRLFDAYRSAKTSQSGPKSNWATSQRPFATFSLFSLLVLAVASLHLINFGNDSFDHIARRNLVRAQGQPRTFFMGESAECDSPAFRPAKGRKLTLFPSDFSDVTQLYGTKSSDDASIAGSMERAFFPSHEKNPNCVPMSEWQTKSFPTCNSFHEMGIVPSLFDNSMSLLSTNGSWRDAWRFKTGVVIKMIKYQKHSLQERYFEFSRVDALAMERLTSNPYVMNAYGFCGVSVITERGVDDIAHLVNHLSPRNKVDLARKVAKSIAAVHEIDGREKVALVHNDINVSNFFWGRKNEPLLNDFNIAVLMMKDKDTNKSCSFPGHFPNPQWKSPEEQVGPDGNSIGELNEKVDIYALGNLLFRFATGKGPWREMASSKEAKLTDEQKKHIAHLKADEGKMPAIPLRTLKMKDPYIDVLLRAMKWCYQANPKERPTARQVAEFLQKSRKKVDEKRLVHGEKSPPVRKPNLRLVKSK